MARPQDDPDPFVALADAATVTTAARARAERRERLARAAETATWIGTLTDLAEQRSRVTVLVRDRPPLHGQLTGVGDDHLALAVGGDDVVAHVRLRAVRAIRPEPGHPAVTATGDRSSPAATTVEDVLDRLAEDGLAAVLQVQDLRDPVRGCVVAVGEDVVTVRLDGPEHQLVYLPVAAVDAVLWG